MERIHVAGVNHERTPVEIREKLYFSADELPRLLKDVPRSGAAGEIMVLSTCNRTEAVFLSDDPVRGPEGVLSALAAHKGLRREAVRPHFYVLSGAEAVRHVFRVASGLDSMVFGENEVTGQFKAAYELAVRERSAGKALLTLYRAAMAAVKKIKSGTGVSRGTVSVSHCTVKLADRALRGLKGRKVLIVGAGDMANSAAVAFMKEGVASVDVVNKTHSKAVELAGRYNGSHYRFSMLDRALAGSDIVLCSTASPEPVLRRELVAGAMAARPDRDLFIIDIAVPRDVEAGVGDLDKVHLYDIDDLKAMTADGMRSRRNELARAERMLDECVAKFEKELYVREAAALVGSVRDRIYGIAEEECAAAARRKGLSPAEAENLRAVTIATVGRIIRSHMSGLKRRMEKGEAGGAGLLEAVRRAFSGL